MSIPGWLSLAWDIISGFFAPKKDPAEGEREAGRLLGQQEAQNAQAQKDLKEVQGAVAARDAVEHSVLRNGTDPAAKAYKPGAD